MEVLNASFLFGGGLVVIKNVVLRKSQGRASVGIPIEWIRILRMENDDDVRLELVLTDKDHIIQIRKNGDSSNDSNGNDNTQ